MDAIAVGLVICGILAIPIGMQWLVIVTLRDRINSLERRVSALDDPFGPTEAPATYRPGGKIDES